MSIVVETFKVSGSTGSTSNNLKNWGPTLPWQTYDRYTSDRRMITYICPYERRLQDTDVGLGSCREPPKHN